ncbi:MAG: glutaredoxin 3 [Hyphomicrobiaceae bacterium]|nr:glutaredoxin 3 [Hyphomicrobiaceae bacterium]
MTKIVVYATRTCPYCYRAKQLLNRKAIAFEEIDVSLDPVRRDEMRKLAGGINTVPQIFINGEHIGGCDDLYAMEYDGELDTLLNGN